MLYLLPIQDEKFRNCTEEDILCMRYLLDFFTDFAKEKDIKTILFYEEPFQQMTSYDIRKKLFPFSDYIYLDKNKSKFYHKNGFIQSNVQGWIKKSNHCPISIFEQTIETVDKFFNQLIENETNFINRNIWSIDHGPKKQRNFHYYGHDGTFLFSVEKETIHLTEQKLNYSIDSSIDRLENDLELFFKEIKKKLKLKSLFSDSHYFLDEQFKLMRTPYETNNLKKALVSTHSNHVLEELCAKMVKTKSFINYRDRDFYFMVVGNDVLVTKENLILFHDRKEKMKEAFEVFETNILDDMQKSIESKKNELNRLKKSLL